MVADALDRELRRLLGDDRVRRNAPLAPLTTFRVGGPADLLVEPRTPEEVAGVLSAASRSGVPVTVLGGGSNVLVADAGVRGIVIRMRGGGVEAPDPGHVRADAGVTINGLVRWMIGRGLAGLEMWAGTPGTVGGAIHGNAHFRGRLVSEALDRVTLASRTGEIHDVPASELRFAYDYSRLHATGELVLAALFHASPGDPAALRAVARESLDYRKRTQPLDISSAGCVFQNPDPARDAIPEGVPGSAGALVDRAGLKGARAGGALVSPTHANFIVNAGGATAADILSLVERCRQAVRSRFGVELREEIVYLGFGGPAAAPAAPEE